MKKILLLLSIMLISALLTLTGCAPEETEPEITVPEKPIEKEPEVITPKPEPEPEPEPEPIKELTPEEKLDEELAAGYKLSEEQLTALKAKITQGASSQLLTTSYPKGLTYGEYHVFALGLSNLNIDLREYLVKIEFVQAKNFKNSAIDIKDESIVLEWFRHNKFNVLPLTGSDVAYIPVGVAITNEPTPGLYDFNVVVQEREPGLKSWDDDLKLQFTVKVNEEE